MRVSTLMLTDRKFKKTIETKTGRALKKNQNMYSASFFFLPLVWHIFTWRVSNCPYFVLPSSPVWEGSLLCGQCRIFGIEILPSGRVGFEEALRGSCPDRPLHARWTFHEEDPCSRRRPHRLLRQPGGQPAAAHHVCDLPRWPGLSGVPHHLHMRENEESRGLTMRWLMV